VSDVDHIVVGYDGGSAGADAIAFGNCWCLASGDAMAVVTVHPTPAPIGIQHVDAEWTAHQRDRAEGFLDEARHLVAAGVQAEFRRVAGDSAAHTLHDLAEDAGTLVVLGTRHRSGGRRTAPGSTANRLFQGSGAPVVIVPSGYSRRGAEPLRRVTAAFVGTADGRAALDQAARIARHLGADLRVVTVVPDTRVVPTTGEPERFAEALWHEYEKALGEAVSGLPPVGRVSRVSSEMLDGHVVDALADIGIDDSDLLVIGSRGYGPIRRVFLGGVSAQVVRHARIPVVVVPRGG
jgi:nucleotide-binding universal stress UspA family protein